MKESTLFMHSPLCQLQLVCTVQGIHSFKISLMVQSKAVQLGLINLTTIEIITFTIVPITIIRNCTGKTPLQNIFNSAMQLEHQWRTMQSGVV